MNLQLNDLASQLIEDVSDGPEDLRIAQVDVPGNGLLLDFGVETEGGLEAGCALASICMSGLADIGIVPGTLGDIGWQHVVVQADASGEELWVDGVLVGTGPRALDLVNNGVITVGCYGGGGYCYAGLLDEIQIYARKLTPTEIGDLHGFGSGGVCKPAEQFQ